VCKCAGEGLDCQDVSAALRCYAGSQIEEGFRAHFIMATYFGCGFASAIQYVHDVCLVCAPEFQVVTALDGCDGVLRDCFF
jgi:hypothetical protein